MKEEKLRGRSGYEHLNDPLHILIEAELPANIVDTRLRQAQEIIEELLKPVVCISQKATVLYSFLLTTYIIVLLGQEAFENWTYTPSIMFSMTSNSYRKNTTCWKLVIHVCYLFVFCAGTFF